MLEVGMKIKHERIFRGDDSYNWTAQVLSISPEDNKAKMALSGTGGQWTEDWDLTITENAVMDREYIIIADPTIKVGTIFYRHKKKYVIDSFDENNKRPVVTRDVYGNKSNTTFETINMILELQ